MNQGKHKCRWTSTEDLTLVSHWAKVGTEKLAEQLGRTPDSVQRRARRIGLPRIGKPTHTLEDVKRLTGCTTKEIARACHAVRVRPTRINTRDTRRLFSFSERQVDRVLTHLRRQSASV